MRGAEKEKKWARAEADPIKIFEETGKLSLEEMDAVKAKTKAAVKAAVDFAMKTHLSGFGQRARIP